MSRESLPSSVPVPKPRPPVARLDAEALARNRVMTERSAPDRATGLENRIGRSFVCMVTMGAIARLQTRAAWEIDLAGSRTESERRILAVGRADMDRLYRLAGLLLGNAADAEDATQEALLRAWRSAASLRDPAGADAWLDRILVNICRDRLRRRRTIRFIALADEAGGPIADPFQAVLDRDEVLRAMGDLDADQRIVVVLHYWAGLTLESVADRVGWPVGTVKSRLHHALERMRRRVVAPSPTTEDAR